MFRATTPKHTFTFSVDPNETFKIILITYSQNNNIVLEKHKEDLEFRGFDASFRLTQEESSSFEAMKPVSVQVRVLTYSDEALAFDKVILSVKDVLNDEVLT